MPDAVLLVEGRRVGLEHRELVEQDLAENRRNISSLESTLRNELEKLGLGQDLSVGVGLNAHAPLFRKRSQVNELAKRIAHLVSEQASALNVDVTVALNAPTLARHGFADLLYYVNIQRLRHGSSSSVPGAFVVPSIHGPVESSAYSAVREKEQRLPAYKAATALDEVWLLLVTGESWVQATDSVMTECFRLASTFDAVYLMDTRTDQLQRLDERTDE